MLALLSQIGVSLSILIVWTLRFNNVKSDFQKFKLDNLTRDTVGIIKSILSILLLLGLIWQVITVPVATILALFMIAAQYFHFSVKNSFYKHSPSLVLLMLLIFIIYQNL
jgi:hypothetical protein